MTKLTRTQRYALDQLSFRGAKTAREIPVRSDVLWRLNERGLVSGGAGLPRFTRWQITRAGREALAEIPE